MGKLTAGEVIRLIASSPIILDVQGQPPVAQSRFTGETTAPLHVHQEGKKMSSHALQTWAEAFRAGLLNAVQHVLEGKPADRPLDESDLARIEHIFDSEREMVRNNRDVFSRINAEHVPDLLQVTSEISNQMKRVIASAAQSADMAS